MGKFGKSTHTDGTSDMDCTHADLNCLPVHQSGELQNQELSCLSASINVVLAYDDDVALQAAMEIYRAVVKRLAPDFEFRDFWWRFSAFTEPTLLEEAVEVAAGADMIFCCPKDPYSLPRSVQDWLRLWLTRRAQPDGALVVLLPVLEGKSYYRTLLERDLRETARVGDLEFFAGEYIPNHIANSGATSVQISIGSEEDPTCMDKS